jgi:hypothetical protein
MVLGGSGLGGGGLAGAAVAPAVSPWTVQAAPLLPKMERDDLNGVSCVGARYCIATGPSLAEVWNGTAWVPRRITVAGHTAGVGAVSCPARARCFAVGETVPASHNELALSWNGATWTVMPGSQVTNGVLGGISCVSVSFCVAVGSDDAGTVTLSWNGSTWTVDPTSTQKSEDDALGAVSCASATSCLAIGSAGDTWLAEEWDGSVWTVLPDPPDPAGPTETLSLPILGVSCASAAECMVVSTYINGAGDYEPLALLWNGSAWVPQDVPSGRGGELWGVSCPVAGHCTAVGRVVTGTSALIEAWNGTRWNQQRGVTPPAGSKELYGLQAVSCTAASTCEAVGAIGYRRGSGQREAPPLAAGE